MFSGSRREASVCVKEVCEHCDEAACSWCMCAQTDHAHFHILNILSVGLFMCVCVKLCDFVCSACE